jgi:hypothetical protein
VFSLNTLSKENMLMKIRFILLFTFVLMSLLSWGQIIIPKERGSHEETVLAKHYFGVKLNPTAQSKAVTYMVYTLFYDSTKKYQIITKSDFLRRFSGGAQSKVNADKKNFLNEYDIDPLVFDYMWKVRYPEYPFGKEQIPGWAAGTFTPSQHQMEMLKPFGINHPADMIYGDSLIQFLKAISNPEWVNRYKAK